jgi:hypothetical protein
MTDQTRRTHSPHPYWIIAVLLLLAFALIPLTLDSTRRNLDRCMAAYLDTPATQPASAATAQPAVAAAPRRLQALGACATAA